VGTDRAKEGGAQEKTDRTENDQRRLKGNGPSVQRKRSKSTISVLDLNAAEISRTTGAKNREAGAADQNRTDYARFPRQGQDGGVSDGG